MMGDWYWIYFIAPFAAALAVSEVTLLFEMEVDEDSQTINKAADVTENEALAILKEVKDGSQSKAYSDSVVKPAGAGVEGPLDAEP